MPIRPNALERLAFYRLGLAPAPLLDVFGAFSFRVLLTGLRLGLFEALEVRKAPNELSRQLETDEKSLTELLEALAAIGYVKKSGEMWVNTTISKRWLTTSHAPGVSNGIEYWGRLLDGPLASINPGLSSPPPRPNLYEWLADDQETADIFQEWMLEITALAGDSIVDKVRLGSATRLLDVGGGHGWYAIELCRRNPGLTAAILDHPSATRHTASRVQDAGLTDRVVVVDGDYMTFETKEAYDIVLMFNIVHGHQLGEVTALLARSRRWLAASGRLLIVEQFPVGSGMGRASTAMLGVAYSRLLGGQIHTFGSLKDALDRAGYSGVRRRAIRRAPGNAVIEATNGPG